jgi:hypothetical protein
LANFFSQPQLSKLKKLNNLLPSAEQEPEEENELSTEGGGSNDFTFVADIVH